jgi:D-aspartate ligase
MTEPGGVPGAMVIGGDHRALGVVRSLGRRRIPVWVLTSAQRIAATSCYCQRRLPWLSCDEPSQITYLVDISARYHLRDWSLFPTDDDHAALISRHRARLGEAFKLATSDWPTVRDCYDKRMTGELAARAGVEFPWTRYPRTVAALGTLECNFPVILKPAVKTEINRFTYAKAWRADSRSKLLELYAHACEFLDPSLIMVQELIPGGGEAQFSYGALCREGRPIVALVARRTRQYPVDFGRSSSYVELIEDPEVEQSARRLLDQMSYTGLIELEFKRDCRDGKLKLLDLNPRVWGWHTLSLGAEIDFPYLFWRLSQGDEIGEQRARPGPRWMQLVTDLPAAFAEFRAGRLSIRDYLKSLRGPLEFAVFAPDDFVPALLEAPLLCWWKWSMLGGRHARLPMPVPARLPEIPELEAPSAAVLQITSSPVGIRELQLEPISSSDLTPAPRKMAPPP